jgi:hypothetical protein
METPFFCERYIQRQKSFVSSSITFFAPNENYSDKAIAFSITRYALDWFRRGRNGNTPEKLKR